MSVDSPGVQAFQLKDAEQQIPVHKVLHCGEDKVQVGANALFSLKIVAMFCFLQLYFCEFSKKKKSEISVK